MPTTTGSEKRAQISCIVGCYSLHLYCAKFCDILNRAGEYAGPSLSYCLKDARRDGWLVNTRTNYALCPKCSGKGKVISDANQRLHRR